MKSLNLFTLIAIAAILVSSCSSSKVDVKLKTDVDTMSYALGINMADNLKRMEITNVNALALAQGIQEGIAEKEGIMTNEEAIAFLNEYLTKIQDVKAEENLAEGKKFLEENAKKDGIIIDESGIQYQIITEGTGISPKVEDIVKVNYRGTLIDGTEFDSSYGRGEPAEFQLGRVIMGWQIGLQKMKVGGKYMFYIPAELAYGKNVRQGGPIKPNSVLIFEVELLDVKAGDGK
jgi:FKBP-type peptidyl-prolyl cis-trans isomerase